MEKETFPAVTGLFREGDDEDIAYLIESGAVEISRGERSEKKVTSEISGSGLFGEMALISNLPRIATATGSTGARD